MVSGTCNHEVTFRTKYLKVSILHFSDFFEFKSIQQCWVNLVCQTQIINVVDRPDPTDHKYLKLKRVKFNEKKNVSWNFEARNHV